MQNRIEALRVFAVAAESRNFREAAQRLSVSPQVVTRVVQTLESTLGEPLFHRSTRGVQLTAFGQGLAVQARDAVQHIERLFAVRGERSADEARGLVRVTAPCSLGRRWVLQALSELLQSHPGLQIDLRLSDAVADAVDEQIDVGVRIGTVRDARFVARPVGKVQLEVVGTPALIARAGRPTRPEALRELPTTGLIDPNAGRPWPWLFREGRQLSLAQPVFLSDDADAEFAAIEAGIGYGQVPDFLARDGLRTGRLQRVLTRAQPEPWPLAVYRTQRSPVPKRQRLVFDALVQRLQSLDAA